MNTLRIAILALCLAMNASALQLTVYWNNMGETADFRFKVTDDALNPVSADWTMNGLTIATGGHILSSRNYPIDPLPWWLLDGLNTLQATRGQESASAGFQFRSAVGAAPWGARQVPESGSTAALMLVALAGLGAVYRLRHG